MVVQSIKCNNANCNNRLGVQTKKAESKPILFCSQNCYNSLLLQNEKMSENYYYEDPDEMRHMVKNLMAETKQLHSEVQNLRKIRKTYFEIFKNKNLKREVYKRDWSFSPEGNT